MNVKRIVGYVVFCLITLWIAEDVLRGLGYLVRDQSGLEIYVFDRDVTVPAVAAAFILLLGGFFLFGWRDEDKGTAPDDDVQSGNGSALQLKAELESQKQAFQEEIYRQVVGKSSSSDIPLTRSDDPAVSGKRYYQCPDCGAIHFKDTTILEVVQAMGSAPSGGSTCSECGTRSDAHDIYSGSLDLSATDELIDQMLADPDNVSNDPDSKVWFYNGQPIYGPASSR